MNTSTIAICVFGILLALVGVGLLVTGIATKNETKINIPGLGEFQFTSAGTLVLLVGVAVALAPFSGYLKAPGIPSADSATDATGTLGGTARVTSTQTAASPSAQSSLPALSPAIEPPPANSDGMSTDSLFHARATSDAIDLSASSAQQQIRMRCTTSGECQGFKSGAFIAPESGCYEISFEADSGRRNGDSAPFSAAQIESRIDDGKGERDGPKLASRTSGHDDNQHILGLPQLTYLTQGNSLTIWANLVPGDGGGYKIYTVDVDIKSAPFKLNQCN